MSSLEHPASNVPTLWRVSAFQRAMGDIDSGGLAGGAGLSTLSPSLMADLERQDQNVDGAELLEVAASCLRHAQNVVLHLACDGYVLPVTLFPRERLYHSPMPEAELLDVSIARSRLLQVEPALLRPPGSRLSDRIGAAHHHHPIGPLLWSLAVNGSRTTLLPEIAGSAVYRTAPGVQLRGLGVRGAYSQGIYRLKSEAVPLRTIESWPGFGTEKAARLLNALYLQSDLMISRTHPAALSASTLSQSWRQFLKRRREAA